MRLDELAAYLKAELILPPGRSAAEELRMVAPIAAAASGTVTFIASEDFARFLPATGATAVITATARPEAPCAQLVHKNPYWAFARTAQLFFPAKAERPGASPQAHIEPSATVDPSATIYPFVYIGERAKIGARAVLYPGVYIGDGAVVGEGTVLRANVVLEAGVKVGAQCLIHAGSVLGADGFGFAPGEEGQAKIPQIGTVLIGDDVEIGACSTVDRGALEATVIGRGSKLDDHCHLGHGSSLGEHSIMCAYAGLAGSAKVGNWVVIGGHTGISNKVTVADRVQIGACSGVTKDCSEPGTYIGFPAQPAGEWRRSIARVRRLAALEEKMAALQSRVALLLQEKP